MADEKQLVEKILAGDLGAQTAFYEENARRLYPICVHFLGYQDPEAQDIVQDTFLIAFGKLAEFEFRSSLYTWLSHICVNLCYERLRRRKRVLAAEETDLEKFLHSRVAAQEDQGREEEEKKGRLELLRRLIRNMGEKCRGILELRDQKGESYVNIARILKIPPGTVMSQLARCREALRKLLENEKDGTTL
ncbi:MAG TPA: RNA polymerase sigma factor [bacterium]|nr:RNA polymerase sigma factor [bacterium]